MTRSPRVVWVERQISKHFADARILDVGFVGAFRKAFVHLAIRHRNPQAHVIGLDIDLAGILRHRILNTLAGDAAKLPFQDNSFDAILFLEVLEHVYQPEVMFREFARVLKPGGGLLLTTPNAWAWNRMARFWLLGSLSSRIRREVQRGYLGAPDHVRFFDPLSLMNMLYDHGFDTRALVTKNHSIPFLSRFFQQLAGLDLQFWPMNRLGSYICLRAQLMRPEGKRKLVYVTNFRLPTEKAHGYQTVKMCEAFAQKGTAVVLLHPHRHNPALDGQQVLDYYGVSAVFELRTLPNLDIIVLGRFFPASIFTPLVFIHALSWGLYAALATRREGADLYYTRDSAIAYWLVRLGLPTVYEVHVVPKRGRRWLMQRIAGVPALRLVVVLTRFIKERLVEMGFPAERVVVLPDGVDLSLFEGVPGREACRRRLGLPLDRPIICYIGRFQTMGMEKGIPELVRAMKHLLAAFPDNPPLLLGVGGPVEAVPTYQAIAHQHAVPLEHLRFVDRVPNTEVPYWMRACDVGTIPWPWNEFSAYYTSPLKLFEYMAVGTPIVASDLPSLREVLHDGENAVLVRPGDPQALAAGIRQVLQDPALAARISTQAQHEARHYTWEARAQRILEFIGRGTVNIKTCDRSSTG